MSNWRMAFKDGNQGYSHWDDCKKREVAAITYIPLAHTDLSKYPKDEPRELWSRLQSAQKGSLRKVAYDMKLGDTIYVKEGKKIVGKGTIVREYFFDDVNCIFSQNKDRIPWSHQVKVQWQANFPPVEVLTHAEQHTVLKLSEKAVEQIEKEASYMETKGDKLSVNEIESFRAELDMGAPIPERVETTICRIIRDTALSKYVKILHKFQCQICGYTIELPGGGRYAEAHHIKPLGEKYNGPDVIGNILCVCPNHHAELDNGVSTITISTLICSKGHVVDSQYVDYHNRYIYNTRNK